MALSRRLAHYTRALAERFSILEERDDLRVKGHIFPPDIANLIWREPNEVADYVDFAPFIDQDQSITLIDVGANVGKFTKGFIKHFPKSQVYAFEPVYDTFVELQREVGKSAQCFQLALSNIAAEQSIWVDANSTLNSLERYNDEVNAAYGMQYTHQQTIKTSRLDDVNISFLSQVVLKIDVQGHEVAALEGAQETLKRVDVVLAELSFVSEYLGKEPSFPTCCRLLHQAGLYPVIFQNYGRSRSNYAFERDVIFVRRELLDRIWRR